MCSADAAVASLGGLAGDQPPSVHLRPGDPLSHPLSGERRAASGLVLQLGGDTCRPVLLVDSLCRFTGLADAQYLSAAPVKRPRLAEDAFGAVPDAVEDLEEGSAPLLVVPPRFFHADAPLEYGFRSAFAGQPAAAAAAVVAQEAGGQGGQAGAAKGGALPTNEIDFRATSVPQALTADSEFAPPPAVEAVLGPLFQERVVWSNAALSQRLPTGAAGAQLRRYIPSYAYRFVNGPWHRQWVRRGLDPRVDPSTGPYQCLDYRLPKEWYPRQPRRGSARAGGEPGGEEAPGGQAGGTPSASRGRFDMVHTLRSLPARRTTFFALFDLSQPLIQQLVQQPAQRAVCDEHNGWYVKTTLDAVKAVLRDAFEACALAEGFAAIPQKVRAQAKHSKAARVRAVLADAQQRMDAVAAGGVAYAPRHGGAHGRGDFALVDEDEEDSEEGPDSEDSEDDALAGPPHTGAAFAAALGRAPTATGHARLLDTAQEALDEDADVYDVFD